MPEKGRYEISGCEGHDDPGDPFRRFAIEEYGLLNHGISDDCFHGVSFFAVWSKKISNGTLNVFTIVSSDKTDGVCDEFSHCETICFEKEFPSFAANSSWVSFNACRKMRMEFGLNFVFIVPPSIPLLITVICTCQENNYGYFVDMDKFLEMQQLIKSRVAPSGDLSQNELARAIGRRMRTRGNVVYLNFNG